MSSEDDVNEVLTANFKIRTNRNKDDPDALYEGDDLTIVVFPDERKATKLLVAESNYCVKRSAEEKLALEYVIGEFRLKKAGKEKFKQLQATGKLPTKPKKRSLSASATVPTGSPGAAALPATPKG